jgi:hypothetical protein
MSRRTEYLDLITVRRLEWDPTEQPAIKTRTINDVSLYEQHHTGGVGPKSLSFEHKAKWLLQIEAYHEWTKKWSDIFYHLFVFADGEVWEGRDILRTSQGNISNAVTVHIPGNNSAVTGPQHASLLRIARWATDDPAFVRDHQQRPAATVCSGPNGRAEITRLREELIMADHTHEYQDLTDHEDAVTAKANGIWDGKNGEMAASRSTVAVMSQRVLDMVPVPLKGDRGLRGFKGNPGNDAVVDMDAIIAAVRADLAADLVD